MHDSSVVVLNRDAPGVPLALIHGVGGSIRSWSSVAERLPEERPIVMYTLRGHEVERENAEPPYEISDFTDDLAALIDELGYGQVIIAGFSLGGLIAQAMTLTHPERIAALVVVGSVADRSEDEKLRAMERYREVSERGPLHVAERSVERWFTPAYLAAHPETREATLTRMGSLNPACYAAAYRVLATTDFVDELHAIEVPVLAIAGREDIGSPPHMSEYIAGSVRNGRAVVVPNVKHQLLQETPDIIAKEIDQFVRTIEV